MKSPNNCGGNESAVIEFVNASFKLSENCDVAFSSCSKVQPFRTAKVIRFSENQLLRINSFQFQAKLFVFKDLIQLASLKFDICDKKPIAELSKFTIAYFGIPLSCPACSNSTHCYKNEKLIKFGANTQRLFSVFGQSPGVLLRMEVVHNSGNSCFEAFTKISKKIE